MTDQGEMLAEQLQQQKIPAAVIGFLSADNDRVIVNGEGTKIFRTGEYGCDLSDGVVEQLPDIRQERKKKMREELLKIIEKNSRIDLKELAVILGVEEIDVVNEMAAMEAEGIICGYHTLIDWEKTSIEKVSALIEVRVTPQRGQGFDSIAERIYKYPEVHAVYLISGGFDLLVTLEGKSLKEVSAFVSDKLSTLDSILSTATHFILKSIRITERS